MSKFLKSLVAIFAIAVSVNATVVTFDDLVGAETPISNGYAGLDWNNFWVVDGNTEPANSGYQNGIVSGANVAFNAWGNMAAVSSDVFDFDGTYLTAAWSDGLNVTVVGSLDGVELYNQTVVVNTESPTWFDFNYSGINQISFSSFGGVDQGLGGSGPHFAMDNFTYNSSSVPEPGMISMLLVGMLSFGGLLVARKRK